MKYETVFGDQSLFDGCYDENAYIVIATSNGRKFVVGEFTEYGIVEGDVKSDGLRIAMRRIIAEPKRWTVEDQKAGLLPEVGSEVILRTTGEIATINAANKNMVCLTFSGGGFSPFNVERIDPIETPEERAKREEDEFISSLSGAYTQDGTVKDFFAQGARAAYRKLKGGE